MAYPTDESLWRLEWNEGLSMCLPEIDAEHQRFIRLVNELNEAIIGRMALEVIKGRMQAILDDAVAHFAHEEELFREWGYPRAKEHAQKHAEIVQVLHEIMANSERGGVEYRWIEAGLQIKGALVDHLLTEDMKYRDYCCMSGGERVNGLRCASCPGGSAPGQPS